MTGVRSLVMAVVCLAGGSLLATSAARADDAPQPIGQFLSLNSPLDDRVLSYVKRIAEDLQRRAVEQKTTGVLVLEIPQGTTPFPHIQALTRYLTSSALGSLRTVAWVPQTVTGPNVLVAVACQDVVMQPEAQLGDLGRGQPLEPEDQQIILALAQKRHNPKVSAALIKSMMDPKEELWRIRIGNEEKAETRAVTRSELDALRQTGVVVAHAETIKDAGTLGVYGGAQARNWDILVSNVAENRPEVARLYNLPREALREIPAETARRKVRLIRIEDEIEFVLESFLERQITRAVNSGADTIIFEIDSPGGLLLASINLAQRIAELDPKKVRTVAWVPNKALSGAAIIALGCDDIYMKPDAKIGDAGPIEMKEGGQFERAPEKILSPLRAALKTLAERKGRPVALCEAMADRQLKVFQVTHRDNGRVWFMSEAEIASSAGEWIQGPQVREANGELLLTVEGNRAHELKLAERPVHDLDELKDRLGIAANVRLNPVQKNWVDVTVFLLNTPGMTVLLIVMGVAFIYLEAHFPTSLFGILSLLCFAVFFWSRFLGGTADGLEITLFVLGAGCLAMEIFVVPGFGVFGISGILMMLASMIMASQSFGNLEPLEDLYLLSKTLGTFFAAMVAVGVVGVILSRFLPHVPLFEGMVLAPPSALRDSREPRLAPEWLPHESPTAGSLPGDLIGRYGQTISLLRPAGKARIDGRVVDVVSNGPFIPEGRSIQVVQVSGNRIVVNEA
ncbi:MAG TPA: NfeD family protein [Planctomycetaceae bacterium]|nr:NfeD family protein [Planctomycetaceae bacterium]